MNLSNKKFTKHEFDLLNKNLNFCPRPNQFNKSNFNKDLQAFFRRVKFKAHFRNNQPYEPSEEDLFGPPKDSTWTPKYVNHTVETFIAATSKDFENFKGKKLPNDNLNKMEHRALSDLQKREDIIITKADKGGATVIIDVEDYIREANSQLENTEFYEKLNFNPTEGYSNIVDNRLDELTEEGDLSEEIAEGLKMDNPRTPHFYLLPKIHKEGNPGRPVVSSIDSHTSKTSKYVDYHIQPIAKEIKSYVQDTSDFIEKINQVGTVPENTYLVSMAVRSLYTNIPNEEGIEALEESLDACQSKTTTTKLSQH